LMDVYSVLYSPAAKDDLFGVYSYIATELLEPEIAAMQTDRIRKAIRSLEHLPLRYAHVDWEPWLSMGMHKYIVFYLVHQESREVRIVRIVFSARDLKTILSGSTEL
jgi:toxin ParE1/3/4